VFQQISILYTFFTAIAHDPPLFCTLFPNNCAFGSLLLNSPLYLFWINHFSFLDIYFPCFLSFKDFFISMLLFQLLFTFCIPTFLDIWNFTPLLFILISMLVSLLLLFFSSFFILLFVKLLLCSQQVMLHILLAIAHFKHWIMNPFDRFQFVWKMLY